MSSLRGFRHFAVENKVDDEWVGIIETSIENNISAWCGCSETRQISCEILEHKIESLRIEQAYKGNYHLIGTVDGIERKYVITKHCEEYRFIQFVGLINVTAEYVYSLAGKLLPIKSE